jgi:hypothetical protein
VAKNLVVEAFFIAKVVIDACYVGAGALRYFLDSSRFEAALGKDLSRRLQQSSTLFLSPFSFSFAAHRKFRT